METGNSYSTDQDSADNPRNSHGSRSPGSTNTGLLQDGSQDGKYIPLNSEVSPIFHVSSQPGKSLNSSPQSSNALRINLLSGDSQEQPLPSRKTTRLASKTDGASQTPPPSKAESPSVHFRISNPFSHSFETPKSDASEAWPVIPSGSGNAARTGRVIERLGKELDRSKREISLLSAKLEEEEQRSESSKLSLESLRASATQYESMYDQAQRSIMRKDRRLADIKSELDVERSRRMRAEEEKHETISQSQKDVAKERERARFANAQYETLRNAMNSKEASLRKEFASVRMGLDQLRQQRELDLQTIESLEVVSDEVCKKQDAMDHDHKAMVSNFQIYKDERDKSLQQIFEGAREIQELGDLLAGETQETLGKMRHIINVKESLKQG